MTKLKVLDLFSGIGGFSLGLERTGGFETVAFCEINSKRRADLSSIWPGVPVFEDVRDLRAGALPDIDVMTGGFPCQDISTAGKKAGIHGERTGLYSEIIRLAGELRPRFIILENSADLLTGERGAWAGHVFGELAALGYDAEWHVIPASGLGAPHDRERVWIIATDTRRAVKQYGRELFLGRRFTRSGEAAAVVADHYCERELQSGWRFTDQRGGVVYDPEQAWPETWVDKLPQICSLDDGLPTGLATETSMRFGNSVVPQIPRANRPRHSRKRKGGSMTLNARQDAAPERLEPTPANREYRGRLPSIGALYGRPRECGGPMPIATPTHKAGRRGLPTAQVSKRHHFARDDGDALIRGTADVFVRPREAVIAISVVLRSQFAGTRHPMCGAIRERDDRFVGLWRRSKSRKASANVVGACVGHRSSPCFVATNLGPMVLSVNREMQ